MTYFVTGATGFIGGNLLEKLLQREGTIFVLVREASLHKIEELRKKYNDKDQRIVPIIGNLSQSRLGIDDAGIAKLKSKVAHLFHLAAVYDLNASAEAQQLANVDGTRNTVQFAEAIAAGCFHHTSSIAAAGMYEGTFREDMFDEAENLTHPYFRTKHDSEAVVRKECSIPWRVYRPGLVVGSSKTGEIDKVDGPYYFFKLIQKMRRMLPQWVPTVGIEGGRINMVPVDYVVDAMDYLAHQPDQNGKCFHLVDPNPHRVGDIMNIFANAGHAPRMAVRINPQMFSFIPVAMRMGLSMLTPVRRIRDALMSDLGLPDNIMSFVNYPTRFDAREAQAILEPAGIVVPKLEDYAWRLWDYWERHLDPDLHIDRSLTGMVKGKVVLITGASSGIGLASAHRVAEAGAKLLMVARDMDNLLKCKAEIEAVAARAGNGGEVYVYSCDIADFDACDVMLKQIHEQHTAVDILINNAGRSIRRGIENSYDRFHDFQRTMQLNYFGCLRLTLGVLPIMSARKSGHIINISSIGVLTNAPRFSAYVASKAALDAFTRCAASEFADRGIHFTTINMPLVRTPMTAPTSIYRQIPLATPEEAADLVVDGILRKPERIATALGIFGQVVHAIAPKIAHVVMNTSYRMFPDSSAATGKKEEDTRISADQIAFAALMKGLHL